MMKRLIPLLILLTMILLPGSAPAETLIPDEVTAAIRDLQSEGWIPADLAIRCTETNNYWKANLFSAFGTSFAQVRVDRLSHYGLIYFRRTDCQLPPLPTEEKVNDSFSTAMRPYVSAADEIIHAFLPAEYRFDDYWDADILYEPSENTGVYTCTLHDELGAVIILQVPEQPDGQPTLLAYIDLVSNGYSGYDGYLTLHDAQTVALDAVQTVYGNETAKHLLPSSDCCMFVCDYFLYFIGDNCPESGEGPFWFISFYDRRSYEDQAYSGKSFTDEEEAQLLSDISDEPQYPNPEKQFSTYTVILDAETGEVYTLHGAVG